MRLLTMMKFNIDLAIFGVALCTIFSSCSESKPFEVTDFEAISNFQIENDTLEIQADLTNALTNGITFPSAGDDDYFVFQFKVKNNSKSESKYHYKIYYQNESYKHLEFLQDSTLKKSFNPKSADNFYGSWQGENHEFHVTGTIPSDGEFHTVKDSFRIVGNPRNEKMYFGGKVVSPEFTEDSIKRTIDQMKTTPEWIKEIKEKALRNNTTFESQIYKDAIWVLKYEQSLGNLNNRWKRNPRMGVYNFLLIAGEEKDIQTLPLYVKDIELKDSVTDEFMNPFYYFLHEENVNSNLQVSLSTNILKTNMKMDPSKGVYSNKYDFDTKASHDEITNNCGSSDGDFFEAQFAQFLHKVDTLSSHSNIPVVMNVVEENYSIEEYQMNTKKYKEEGKLKSHAKVSDLPCKTVGYSENENAIFLSNPGNEGKSNLSKENTGVSTRIGLQFGKFTARIKFPEILSEDGVWNGLTCAFWLLLQEDAAWNHRSVSNSGYIPKDAEHNKDIRVPSTSYTEIDIEILKTAETWPPQSYNLWDAVPTDNSYSRDIIAASTNWDLACKDPQYFVVGAREFDYLNLKYIAHRWADLDRSITIKKAISHDEVMGEPYYYQIEWKPNEIIWRMGKTKDNMQVIGYMNETFTNIPDNQMIAIISQEFHQSSWWPTTPFKQDYIPFPKNDLTGYVFEVEIE